MAEDGAQEAVAWAREVVKLDATDLDSNFVLAFDALESRSPNIPEVRRRLKTLEDGKAPEVRRLSDPGATRRRHQRRLGTQRRAGRRPQARPLGRRRADRPDGQAPPYGPRRSDPNRRGRTRRASQEHARRVRPHSRLGRGRFAACDPPELSARTDPTRPDPPVPRRGRRQGRRGRPAGRDHRDATRVDFREESQGRRSRRLPDVSDLRRPPPIPTAARPLPPGRRRGAVAADGRSTQFSADRHGSARRRRRDGSGQ